MINRVFFISDQEFISRGDLPSDEHVFYPVLADPGVKDSLQEAYSLASDSKGGPLVLALNLQGPLSADSIRSIASFLFLPAYLRIADKPVMILMGDSAVLLWDSAVSLSSYLSGQGFSELTIHPLLPEKILRSPEELGRYQDTLKGDPCYGHDLFFSLPPGSDPQPALAILRSLESVFSRQSPQLYSLILAHVLLEEKFNSLDRKYAASALELQHQRQYADALRSGHAAREIQDFYNKEYEILPLWYKRLGHLVKVLTGKRTFASLFRDNVKKYKD